MGFKGLEDDGSEVYDTKEEALERVKMLRQWHGENLVIYVQRDWCPTWFARLFQNTPLDWIGYYKEEL